MKLLKVSLLATAAIVAYLPLSAGAFGFGASRYEYAPPPWAGYGPQQGQPSQMPPAQQQGPGQPYPMPYGPPPGARNVQGMWGSGPGMSWGPRDPAAAEAERQKKLEHYRNPWKWTKDWKYVSPYDNANPE